MFNREPKYEVEVKPKTGSLGPYGFYVWNGMIIVASGYKFPTATDAANAGVAAKEDLLNAWKIANGKS